MKVCYLANAYSIHTQRWAEYFAEKSHEVDVISPEQPNTEINGVAIHVIKTNKRYLPMSFPYKFLQFRRIINDIYPDVIHAHYVTNYGVIGALTAFHPFVVSAWGDDVLINPKESRIYKLITKYALKKADLVTCDGEKSKDAMVNLGINPKKIKLIYHGVDTKVFTSEQRSKEFREELEIFDSPTVISIRQLEPEYDVGTLIKSIPLIVKKIPNAKFIIAGEGPEEGYLKGLAESLGILDSIRFVGWIPHDELAKYLASSDVYVSTSLSDSFVVSTLEAMACELAPVVTAVGDNRKWIKDGENGFVVPIKNPDYQARFK